jgi:F-type H+-transporting ATPase subunit epsilon
MQLKILLPSEILLDMPVGKVVAEAGDGWFAILPRHVDFVAALVPSVLIYTDVDRTEHFLGIDEGILVKCGTTVEISTRNAVQGTDLEDIRRTVRAQFHELDERERAARSVLARLEAGVVRRFIELQERMQ